MAVIVRKNVRETIKLVVLGMLWHGIASATQVQLSKLAPADYTGTGECVRANGTGYRFTISTSFRNTAQGITMKETLSQVRSESLPKPLAWERFGIIRDLGNGFYDSLNADGKPISREEWSEYCTDNVCHVEYRGSGPTGTSDPEIIRHFEETWTFQKDTRRIDRVGSRLDRTHWLRCKTSETRTK